MNLEHVNWMGLLISWFPMLLLIAVWLFFVRTMQSRGGIYANQKRAADALERIAAALEKRSF